LNLRATAIAVVLGLITAAPAAAEPLSRGENPRQPSPAPAATGTAAPTDGDISKIKQGLASRATAAAQMRAGLTTPSGARISAVAQGVGSNLVGGDLRQTIDALAAADAARPGDQKPQAPFISTVNGKASGAQVTPGAHLTIRGYGFAPSGGTPSAWLVSAQFAGAYGGKIPLNIDSADNGKIVSDLPADVTSVLDDPGATVEVASVAGPVLHSAPLQFVATRETVGWILFKTNSAAQLQPFFNGVWKPAGNTPYRYAEGENIDCPAQGAGDEIKLQAFRPGFYVSSASMVTDRTDAGDGDGFGNAGSRVVFGQYALQITSGSVYASWAVWRSHRSPIEPIPGVTLQDPQDICLSNYTLEIYITGPKGLTAW
jgi:hypothetical protein